MGAVRDDVLDRCVIVPLFRMAEMGKDGVIAVAGASPGRRILACGVVYGLGALLIYLAFVEPPALPLLIILVGFGCAILWLAETLRRVTRLQIVLRAEGLFVDNGMLLAEMDEIISIDRGALAFKPSNGFTLKLKSKHPRSWAPGVWWRFGRFVGVGGAVSAGQAKFMAERIALVLAQRDAD